METTQNFDIENIKEETNENDNGIDGVMLDLMQIVANMPPRVKCKMCDNSVFEGRVTCEECRATQMRKLDAVNLTCRSVPSRWDWAHFNAETLYDRVKNNSLIKQAEAMTSNLERALLFGTEAGTGKTTLAVCLLKRIAGDRSMRGHFISAVKLAPCRANSSLGRVPGEMREALDAPILLIDDLGYESKTHNNCIPDIIHQRFEDTSLVTIVTTGLSSAQLAAAYGEGIKRRLVEGAAVMKFDVLPKPGQGTKPALSIAK